ncbi:MAG: serine hydrolase [Phycisphaerales bacterium]|nr:MAG: serine hydrolase [Phycisphaerales bacterium]
MRPSRQAVVLLLLPLALAGHGPAEAADNGPRDKSARVDRLFECTLKSPMPGAAAVAIHRGKVLYERGYGMANLEYDIPITPTTKFRIGSMTKQFTALCILQLSERGFLHIDGTIARYFPDSPNAQQITVRHLLTHTSGITDKLDSPLEFEPGERLNYSNAGYCLLGDIVEKAAGVSYEQYLTENVLKPLGMLNTGCDRRSKILKNRASGYSVTPDGGFVHANGDDVAAASAAGAMYSTVEDLCRWDQALQGSELVRPETLRQAFRKATLKDGREMGYGFGWMIGQYRGLEEICHGGTISGFNAWISRFPNQQFTVIVLSNIDMGPSNPLSSAGDLGHKIAGIYLADLMQEEEPQTPQEIEVATEIIEAYAGKYQVVNAPKEVTSVLGETVEVILKDNRLVIENAGIGQLRAESETRFFSQMPGIKITFLKDATGAVTGLALTAGQIREIHAERIP